MPGFQVNRIGFINFWLYDEEDFYFYDGKLLLRGGNGSGKTVTMQSFFPLIFDGNKSPERLDPFGSRDRKIEDYLLPEDYTDSENTGYLYMEFFNKSENKYLTIGIGLRAIRNRSCEFWGFAITDGRRIGIDFLLFREKNLRYTLTKKELQTRIGSGGEFVETTKDYKRMVNKLLFGFQNLDLYTEFINLLMQVRSPKLSNSTKPKELTQILSSVLEPLSEDDLRVMADSIEDMNKYKEKLNDLTEEQKACNSLKSVFDEYNRSLLYTKGENFLKYKNELSDGEKNLKKYELELQNLTDETSREEDNIKALELEKKDLIHRRNKLDESDVKSINNQLEEIINDIKEAENEKSKKEEELREKSASILNMQKELETKENLLYKTKKSFEEQIKDLTSYEEIIDFDEAKFYLDDLKKEQLNFKEMDTYVKTVRKQVNLLNVLTDISYKIHLKEEEINFEKENYTKKNDNLTALNNKHKDVSKNLLESSLKFKDNIAKTANENKVLILEQNDLDNIYKIIDKLEKDMFLKVKDFLKNQVYKIMDKLKLEISNNNAKINDFKIKNEKSKEELANVKNLLTNKLDDQETIDYFKEKGIDYKYFFEVIEFKDSVSLEKRRQIESFLLETGILTAFITNQNITNEVVKNKCLNVGIPVKNNLLTFLDATNSPYKDKATKILASISVDGESNIINILDSGKYQYALFEGMVDLKHNLRYIGEKTRTEFIEKEQEKITISINQYQKEIESINEKNVKLNDDIIILETEFNNFTFPLEIDNYFKELDKITIELETINENITVLVDIIKTKTNELKSLEEQLNDNKKGYYGSTKYLDIKDILENTNNYLELVKELAVTFKEYETKEELVLHYNLTIESANYDLDNIKIDLDNIVFKLNDYNNKKKTVEDILNSDKYRDVSMEYQKIRERIPIIDDEIRNKDRIIVQNQTNSKHLEKTISELKMSLIDKEILKNVTYKIFMDEYELYYVDTKEIEEHEISQFIKSLKPNNSNREIYEKFSDSANKFAQLLINYAPKNTTLHLTNGQEYLNYTNDESKKELIMNLFEDAKRRDLIFNYLGKNVNLIELTKAIDTSITSYQDLISEENRRLFEDLLINNIGSSIRMKIYQSEEWIEEVRKLMESMNTTSGLSFSLKWLGNTALTEEELDTKEIVNIFKKDAESLKQEHLTKITNHFKSKIKMKEEMLEESERNYLEIIKDVLDYRKWFEFKLYFKRGNSDMKELTDREFNKMSGGEKAIAMYIPLFSSIYAKLNSAKETAPHIIALDEAFAGVDDDNIKDAFRILDKLDIDYVLTSQQLWGDYETVKHLAISELHHPVGSKVVSVIKYKWDGISRSKIDDISEYQD